VLALPGAILGRAVALRSVGPPARAGFAALLAPLVVLASPRQAAPSHEVVTAVDIDAPPAVVWRHVVTFPELPPPRAWLFRAGVAAPLRALCAAGLQRADRTRPASDTSAVPDTTATRATPAPGAVPTPTPPPSPGATKLIVVEGFLTPESVLHDPAQDIYFVSNINGGPTTKDNNGFISRVRPDGAVENLKFIEGGHGGATLNAPKGLALRGDTLWVADIDMVRSFDA